MARSSAALKRAEKALASTRKRAADLRKNIKKDQPIEVAVTALGGGALDGYIQRETPAFLRDLNVDPGVAVGLGLVAFGMFSAKNGRLEQSSTQLGTGVLACATSRYIQGMV